MIETDALRPTLPGLDVERLLGSGAHAQVWLAHRGGHPVAVKVARPAAVDRLRHEGEVLDDVRHPHLVALLDRFDTRDGGHALVLEYAQGGALADLVAARGRLSAPETTTVVVPVARALAALHARGLVHADVSAGNVLLTHTGKPLLADLGAAGCPSREAWGTPGWTDPPVAAGRQAPTSASDVWALGALIRFCLTGDPGGQLPAGRASAQEEALLAVAARCEAPETTRPDAAQVSRAVWDACPPRPIALAEGVDHAVRPGGTTSADPAAGGYGAADLTRRIRRDAVAADEPAGRARGGRLSGGLAAILAPALVWLAVLAGAGAAGVGLFVWLVPDRPVASARPAPAGSAVPPVPAVPAASPVPTSSPTAAVLDDAQALAVVRALAQDRAAALTAGSPQALERVDLPGSAALADDRAVLDELRRRGLRYEGLAFTVSGARPVGHDGDRWRVEATVTTSAFRQVDAQGSVVVAVPQGQPTQVTLVLVRTADGWRVESSTHSGG